MTDYLKEARKVQRQGDYIRAGDLYVLGGSDDEAIEMYLEGKSFAQAARLLEKQENWRAAAQCYAQANNVEKAAKMYSNLEDWDKAASMFERAGDFFRASEMYEKDGNLQKAAEFADKAEKWERAAPLYEKAGNMARAADLYCQLLERVIGDQPDEAGLLESRRMYIHKYGTAAGRLYYRLHNFDKAAYCFEKAENPAHAGKSFQAAGQFQRAAEMYVKAEDFRNASEMMEKIGKVGVASDLAEKAKDFERAAALAEKAGQSLRAALLYAKAQKPAKAADLYFQLLIQSIDEASKSNPASHRTNIQKYGTTAGTLYLNAKNFAKAGWCFERAGQIAKAAECFVQGNLPEKAAELFVKAKNYDKAYDLLMEAKEIQNRELLAEVLFHKGQYMEAGDLYRMVNRLEKAADSYEQAGQLYKAAMLFEEVGQLGRAAQLYSQLQEYKKAAGFFEASKDYKSAATAYEQAGNLEKAAECAVRTGEKLFAARLLAQKGELQKAVSLLQGISHDSEEYGEACRTQGVLLLQMDMHSLAAQKLTEGLADQPLGENNLELYYKFATALEATANEAKAADIYQRILSIQFDYLDVLDRVKRVHKPAQTPVSMASEGNPLPFPAPVSSQETGSANDLQEDLGTSQISLQGKRIREYEILQMLGKGGMGTVYRARHIYLDKERAIKVIRGRLNNSSFSDRFIREARILSDLHHPNLVQLFEFGSLDSGAFFMVLEMIEGESVKARIRKMGKISVEQSIAIVREAALGLQKAHEMGIIHRDISPDNLMLVPDGGGKEITKVIDFGIAKALLEEAHDQTMTNTFIGKPEYASPEQCGFMKQGETIDARSDIFSLGVTLHYMIAGSLPFSAPNQQGYLVKHMTQKARPLSEVFPEASPALTQFLQKAMANRREKRHASMEEFLRDLNRL